MKILYKILSLLRAFVHHPQKVEGEQMHIVRRPRYFTLAEIHAKHYASKIDYVTFRQVVCVDPSFNPNKPDKMGKYGKWLLSLYLKGNLLWEDCDKARRYLDCFDRYRRRLRNVDLNSLKSLPDLYNIIREYLDAPDLKEKSEKEIEKEIKANEAIRLYEDNEWIIIQPLTRNAAVIYGRGTQWCTSSTTSYNYFEYYNSLGPLHILISKKNGRKYQFHLATQTYCDETDRRMSFPVAESVEMSVNVANYYQSLGWYNLFDFYRLNRDDNYFLKLGNQYYLFSCHCRIIPNITVDKVIRYVWGGDTIYMVQKGNKHNAIWAKESQMMLDDWYEKIQILSHGILILSKQKTQRVYKLVAGYLDDWIQKGIIDFKTACAIWGQIADEDRKLDLSSLDKQLFSLVETISDYRLYLKLFGKNALHYKQARYKLAIPMMQFFSLLGALLGVLTVNLVNNPLWEGLGNGLLVLCTIAFLLLVFSSKFIKNLKSLITFLTTHAVLITVMTNWGPKIMFCLILGFFLILFIIGRISKFWESKTSAATGSNESQT